MTEHDKIKSAVNGIEPENGARERMLANIKRKAAEQAAAERKPLPFAAWAAPLAACLVIAAAAAIGVRTLPGLLGTSDSSEYVQSGSPFQSALSAAEFTARLGITLDAPDGASDVQYAFIDDEIADVSFVYGGVSYTARASRQSGDFSGIIGVCASTEQLDSANNAVLTKIISDEEYLKLTWVNDSVNYILTCKSADAAAIKTVYSRIAAY